MRILVAGKLSQIISASHYVIAEPKGLEYVTVGKELLGQKHVQ